MDAQPRDGLDKIDVASILGYLNFSNGRPDPRFQVAWNTAQQYFDFTESAEPCLALIEWLRLQCPRLSEEGGSAFKDLSHAVAMLEILKQKLIPEYGRFHTDLLGHVTSRELFSPFFIVRMIETLLAESSLTVQQNKLVSAVLHRLNDFLGYRPIATLENRQLGEPYAHERFRPIPLYIRQVGCGHTKYHALILEAMQVLTSLPEDILDEASFDLNRLEEWAYDPRNYDHSHPANRRPNYVFGEWDPHSLDEAGQYQRYVSRAVTLQILSDQMKTTDPELHQEYTREAGIVLAGTVLMASAMSGRAPGSYDSTVKLSTLVPRIAKLRDNFYSYCFSRLQGQHRKRMAIEAEELRQPFGRARQSLNQAITRHRAEQLQNRHIAIFLSDLGNPREAVRRLRADSPLSDRFQQLLKTSLTNIQIAVKINSLNSAESEFFNLEEILHRGIECGALPDPWNALGFQAQFPIFQSMEDAVLDHRLIELCEFMDSTFQLAGRVMCEAAASGQHQIASGIKKIFKRIAMWWDQYATFEVTELPRAAGEESLSSAMQVAEALTDWHQLGQTSGDLAFWRKHLHRFQSASSFAAVVDVLHHRKDYSAAMALMISWLSHATEVPLEDGKSSLYDLMLKWFLQVLQSSELSNSEQWKLVKRFIDLIEANAEDYLEVTFDLEADSSANRKEENPYAAAYEGMEYRDTTDDGVQGSLSEEPMHGRHQEFPLEQQSEVITQKIHFQAQMAHLWKLVARQAKRYAQQMELSETLSSWWKTAVAQREKLLPLLDKIQRCPVPEPLGNQASMMEYDRQRNIKDKLLEAGISAVLDISMAERSLHALSYAIENKEVPSTTSEDWEHHAVQMENLLYLGKIEKIPSRLKLFLSALGSVSLLYKPVDAGGRIHEIIQTRTAQTILRELMMSLPRQGMVQETYQVLKVVRDLERAQSIQGRVVTEFNRLFESAMNGLTLSISRSAQQWKPSPEPAKLVSMLDLLVKPFLMLWIDHSHSVRLSSVEAIHGEEEWLELREFIRKFGSELFHPKFMTLANLRAILSRGVHAYLTYLEEDASITYGEDANTCEKLLIALRRKLVNREQIVRQFELVLKAIVENYEEYKDYNATTTQSDYGENLFRLVAFLRLKSTYERHVWNIKPLIWVHDTLAREGQFSAALIWKQTITRMTSEISQRHMQHLKELQSEHGMQLRTVADLIAEQFTATLDVDTMTALVIPAYLELQHQKSVGPVVADRPSSTLAAFERLLSSIDLQTRKTTGSGLDVPVWIRKLEQEVDYVTHHQQYDKAIEPPFYVLDEAKFSSQMESWNTNDGDVNLLPN